MGKLSQRFLAGKVEEEDFHYIGFKIKQTTEGIQFDHSVYMEKLNHQQIAPQHAFQKLKELNQDDQKKYLWKSTKLKCASVGDVLCATKNIGK